MDCVSKILLKIATSSKLKSKSINSFFELSNFYVVYGMHHDMGTYDSQKTSIFKVL